MSSSIVILMGDVCGRNSLCFVEGNMVSETLRRNRPANGESEKRFHKHSHGVSSNGISARDENLNANGVAASFSFDESSGEEDMRTLNSKSVDGAKSSEIVVSRKTGQREMTFQDMYSNQDLFDDDDEDDSDWEPVPKHVEIVKWFCTNCTMINLHYVVHCNICGEHKESGILRHGFHASPILQHADLTDIEPEVKGRHKDISSQSLSSNNCTAIGFDERMLLHSEVEVKSNPHPERPDRLRAIAASLATAGIFPGRCHPISAREITQQELKMAHSMEHIQDVELTSHIFSSYFTPDTYANQHSALAARLAAGLCVDLASAIISGRAKNGFALVRPPGHHAGVRRSMGFCLHNNAAVSALAAQLVGAKKVLIVDWDVHHGNGTQEIFEQNNSVLYISLHRHEGGNFYPGTGAAYEIGTNGAEGYCVNIPWSHGGVGDNDYIFAFQNLVLPIAAAFAPDFTIISAGFDAARGDPLGCCDVTPTGYAQMTDMLYALSGGKLLVILEGGYNLRSISSSATAVIKVLLGERTCELDNIVPSRAGLQAVFEVLKIQMNFWPCLASNLAKLQSQWGLSRVEVKKKEIRKRLGRGAPIWWKWGRKKFLYYYLNRHLRRRRRTK
ncbi:LOW QUALITY PROTEIN: histone deacetylase 15 [Euphorbia lathyris]|uniref:LOW QUALITY PROTEIN: histone deacetylase 15 n=1 Tax=Euphorbia lathyris TaxID=212925 RepID=UPI0033141E94